MQKVGVERPFITSKWDVPEFVGMKFCHLHRKNRKIRFSNYFKCYSITVWEYIFFLQLVTYTNTPKQIYCSSQGEQLSKPIPITFLPAIGIMSVSIQTMFIKFTFGLVYKALFKFFLDILQTHCRYVALAILHFALAASYS